MSEIDLVPLNYRHSIRLRAWLRGFVVVYAALLLSMVAAKAGLSWTLGAKYREVEELQAAEEMVRDQEAQLAQIRRDTNDARRRLSILSGLRGGISTKELFLAMDAALDHSVWFLDWTFRRAGEFADSDPKAVQTGYFLVIPIEVENEQARAWRLETHMEIQGQARNHSTLASFVGRLLDQPRIAQVRIVKTRVRQIAAAEVVDFELAIIVRTAA